MRPWVDAVAFDLTGRSWIWLGPLAAPPAVVVLDGVTGPSGA